MSCCCSWGRADVVLTGIVKKVSTLTAAQEAWAGGNGFARLYPRKELQCFPHAHTTRHKPPVTLIAFVTFHCAGKLFHSI
eukprot:1148211-Pelagomonas_calceolata.AAC.3